VVPSEQLSARAVAVAEQFAAIPADVFTATKQAIRAETSRRIREDASGDAVVRMWASPSTRQSIQQYLDRVVRKR